MRTTLNIDQDVATQLAERAAAERRSVSRVANDLMRSGLLAERHRAPMEPYDPPTFDTGRPLVDVTKVADALELLD